jgi:hypothetical protein
MDFGVVREFLDFSPFGAAKGTTPKSIMSLSEFDLKSVISDSSKRLRKIRDH